MFLRKLFFGVALLACCAVSGQVTPSDAESPGEVARVLRVIDGDTIEVELNKKVAKVRLIGVDTPETVHPQKKQEHFGKEASDYTKKFLEKKSVTLKYNQARADRYGRLLAYVYVEINGKPVLFNEKLVRDGYGHAYLKFPFEQSKMELLRQAQSDARENKRGLWGDTSKAPADRSVDGKTPVYLTKTGTKYHREGCRFLGGTKVEISLEEALLRGGKGCVVCKPPE